MVSPLAADVAGNMSPCSPRHRRCSAFTPSRRHRRSLVIPASPRPGSHCPARISPDRSDGYLSHRATLAPAPFTVRHLSVRSEARPARSPWPSLARAPPRRSGLPHPRGCGGGRDPGSNQPMSASHDSFCKERAPPSSRHTPRRISTRPGSPRFHAEELLRRASRRLEAFPPRAACAGVPLTLRHRAPLLTEASTEVEPPSRLGERASTERNVHRVGPLVTLREAAWPSGRKTRRSRRPPLDPREWTELVFRPKRLLLPPPHPGRRIVLVPRPLSRAPPDGARNIAVSTDPRGTTLVPRPSRVDRPSSTSRQSTGTRCPSGGVPRTRRPKTTWPEAACRSPTDPPHHRWSARPVASSFSQAEAHGPKTTPRHSLRHPASSGRDLPRMGPSRRPRSRPRSSFDRSRFPTGCLPPPRGSEPELLPTPLSPPFGRTRHSGGVKRLFDLVLSGGCEGLTLDPEARLGFAFP